MHFNLFSRLRENPYLLGGRFSGCILEFVSGIFCKAEQKLDGKDPWVSNQFSLEIINRRMGPPHKRSSQRLKSMFPYFETSLVRYLYSFFLGRFWFLNLLGCSHCWMSQHRLKNLPILLGWSLVVGRLVILYFLMTPWPSLGYHWQYVCTATSPLVFLKSKPQFWLVHYLFVFLPNFRIPSFLLGKSSISAGWSIPFRWRVVTEVGKLRPLRLRVPVQRASRTHRGAGQRWGSTFSVHLLSATWRHEGGCPWVMVVGLQPHFF